MSSVYANIGHSHTVDEVRYQTIGRGHGFSELGGVPFMIAKGYQHSTDSSASDVINQLATLQINKERALEEASLYTFELERKVLQNMQINGT